MPQSNPIDPLNGSPWADPGRFRAIFDGTHLGMCIVDLDGRFVETNRAYQELLGYSADELRGTEFTAYTHPDDVSVNVGMWKDQLAAAGRFRLEKRYVRKDGEVVWVDISSATVADGAGTPLFTFAIAENITERKQLAGAAAPGPEDGGDRTAGRRDRPRLQQPPDRDRRQRRDPAAPRAGCRRAQA